jgi:signal peptide peptidase SppA
LLQFDLDKFLSDKPLAITMSGLEELRARVAMRLLAFDTDTKALIQTIAAERAQPQPGRPRSQEAKATGVISVRGTISQHAGPCEDLIGGGSTEGIASALRAFLSDDDVSKIVLDIDSPGGTSYGVAELADEIIKSRGQKPIIAVANSLAASAAYWIAAACDQVFVTPGGLVGSIGVYCIHQDISKAADDAGVKVTFISAGKYKVDGNQFEPLGDDARSRVQARVDDVYGQFVRDVARGRGLPEATVRSGFGEGDVVTAKKAVAEGMADGVMTLDAVIAKTFRLAEPTSGAKVEDISPPTEDEPTEEEIPTDGEDQARLTRFRFRAKAAAAGAA